VRKTNFAFFFTPKGNDKTVGAGIVEFFGAVVSAFLKISNLRNFFSSAENSRATRSTCVLVASSLNLISQKVLRNNHILYIKFIVPKGHAKAAWVR